jgi:hypothetical protein
MDVRVVADGVLCIAGFGDHSVQFMSRDGRTARVSLPVGPCALAGDPYLAEVYATSPDAPSVFVVDSRVGAVIREIALPAWARPGAIAVTAGAKFGYVVDSSRPVLFVLDLLHAKPAREIKLAGAPWRLLLAEDLGKLYVGTHAASAQQAADAAGKAPGRVDVVDLKSFRRIGSITVPGAEVAGLAVDPKRKVLYCLSAAGPILSGIPLRADGTAAGPARKVKIRGERGLNLIHDPRHNLLYAGSQGLNGRWVSIVDPGSLRTVNGLISESAAMALGQQARPPRRTLYLADAVQARVNAVDVTRRPAPPAQ